MRLALLVFLLSPSVLSLAGERQAAEVADRIEAGGLPFAAGEALTFSVAWQVFDAGEINVTLTPAHDSANETLRAEVTARSSGFISLLYRVENRFDSFFGAKDLCSQRILKKIRQGRRHKNIQIVFDGDQRRAVLHEHDLAKPSRPPQACRKPHSVLRAGCNLRILLFAHPTSRSRRNGALSYQ